MSAKPQPRIPLLRIVKAVLWSFFGIRRRAAYEEDAASLKPVHVIVAGIIAALVFVLSLVTLVHFITG